jgi:putative endonuclease
MSTVNGKTRIEQGQWIERAAAEYLQGQGLHLLERNYHCRSGEIDLVMRHGSYLVFVEVRYRKHAGFGGAAASVDRRKQHKLLNAAQHYLLARGAGNRPCRFDVVAVSPRGHSELYFNWITNAFELD